MKSGLKNVIGKEIVSVVVGRNNKPPQNQVILVFSDGTQFEFYGDDFTCTGGVDKGYTAHAVGYIENNGGTISNIYQEIESK